MNQKKRLNLFVASQAENCVPYEEMAECLLENSSSGEEEEREWRHQQFRHAALVHRYDYEVGRRNFLVSQSTFILSVIGLVMTLCLTLCTADRFSLSYVDTISLGFILLGLFMMLVSSYFAITVLYRIYGREYNAAYPSNEFISLPLEKIPRSHKYLENINAEWSLIVGKNSTNNDISSRKMRRGLIFFIGGISYAILMGVMLVVKLLLFS